MVRYNLIFKGRVQGVGFRYRAMLIADKLGLTGDITNLYNGDVECNIQGDKEKIDTFISRLDKSRFIYIDEVVKKEIKPIEESEFKVK